MKTYEFEIHLRDKSDFTDDEADRFCKELHDRHLDGLLWRSNLKVHALVSVEDDTFAAALFRAYQAVEKANIGELGRVEVSE